MTDLYEISRSKPSLYLTVAGILLASVGLPVHAQVRAVSIVPLVAAQGQDVVVHKTFLENHCEDCHNAEDHKGGFSTSQLNLSHPELTPALNEKIIAKLRAGMMPPRSRPRPAAADQAAFTSWLETSDDRLARRQPYVGFVGLHRLNRAEYANSVRSLLDLDVNIASLLPPDDMSHGFNNIADAMTVSPALLKAYVDSARKISYAAVGDLHAASTEKVYRISRITSQARHVDGTPYGTRGGMALTHNFPADGYYVFKLGFFTEQGGSLFGANQGKGQQIEVAIGGKRVALFDINPKWKVGQELKTPPLFVRAGAQEVSASFIMRADGPVQDEVQPYGQSLLDVTVYNLPGLTTLPHLYSLAVVGPTLVTGISPNSSRNRIFICRPVERQAQDGCAYRIVTHLVRQAYRKPASKEDVDLALRYYKQQREAGASFDEGIRAALQSILANPEFIFRFEHQPPGGRPNGSSPVSDLELASRLSYFLWSAPPDEELLRKAVVGKLHRKEELEHQVRRMLQDSRSSVLASNFASQWLNLKNLNDVLPDAYLYPNFDNTLKQSMIRETELFFSSIVREDRDVLDLLNADYTFVDETLAIHYGMQNVLGNRFRRVHITDENRRGLLGQASILTLTSTANRTSPVARGKWILQVLFGAPPPPPPPNIPALHEAGDEATPTTVRQRLEQHRKDPSCASCHMSIDAQGFALENFDPTGAWRSLDSGRSIDATGKLFDGSLLDGPASLRTALLAHSGTFLHTFTENLLAYGLGRVPDYHDQPLVRSIDARAAADGNRFSVFVLGIVESDAFQRRASQPADPAPRKTILETASARFLQSPLLPSTR